MMYLKWITVLVSMLFLELSCSPDKVTGNGSQTGNPVISGMLFTADGKTPACSASVYVRIKDTASLQDMAVKKNSDTAAVTITGCDGIFEVDSINAGLYFIEGTDGVNNLVLIDSVRVLCEDSTLKLPPAVLKPAGAIKGNVVLSEGGDPRKVLAILPTPERITMVDSLGNFKFDHIAEGRYAVRILPSLDNYEVFDTAGVSVASGDTTNLSVISLPFTGIPAVKHVAITYDTMQQKVILSWNKPGTAIVKSFNVYRREVNPLSAFITQLNFCPVVDTFFIDSSCQQNKSYEYHITAVDSNTNEGVRSTGVTTRIALYNIVPENIVMKYDTLRQKVTLQWSNPDTGRVTGYNVYRRNVPLNEKFWTPYNSRPLRDTFFVDSTFILGTGANDSSIDFKDQKQPMYEYCVAAMIHGVQEGARSKEIQLQIALHYVTPANLQYTYDTLNQQAHLRWNRPDMTIVRGFTIYRKCLNNGGELFSKIGNLSVNDTLYTDSTGVQNKFYEYRVASVIKNNRSEVKSEGVNVHIAASFIEDTVFSGNIDGMSLLSFPNDIAVAADNDIYIVNQGSSCIEVFDSSMNCKRSIGKGILDYPLRVSVDEKGMIFAADYNRERDYSSVYVFDTAGTVVDTLLDSIVLNDIDAKNGVIYTVSEGRTIATYSYDGNLKKTWQMSGLSGDKCIVADGTNKIFVSTGLLYPDKNKIVVFDSLGNSTESKLFPFYPHAIAYHQTKQLLYVICGNGAKGSVLHVIDSNNIVRARYKILSIDQNISMGIQNNGVVFIVLKGEGKILKLKPLANLY
jgi:fibronectin type 3 domain-containing protein